jgi:hypothetical protein
MELVYKESKKYSNYPTTISAICLTESSLGKNRYNKEGSLGLMQMQVDTAIDVIRWYPKMLGWMKDLKNYQIASFLLNDDELSIEIATLLFEFHRKRAGYQNAIVKYNGWWEVNRYGRAVFDNAGKRIKNLKYFERVEANKKRIARWRKL